MVHYCQTSDLIKVGILWLHLLISGNLIVMYIAILVDEVGKI